jgi:hypothetical protein
VTSLAALTLTADPDAWAAIGLPVHDGWAKVGGVRLQFVRPVPGMSTGVVGWTLAGCPDRSASIDGLPTEHLDAPLDAADEAGELGVVSFDHVVVMTASLERTCGAIEAATGEPLKRIREAGPVRQGFHRLGPAIVEVVETDRLTVDHALFWGFVLVVADIHEVAGRLGPDVVSLPKSAVQPGRFIASFRSDVGLGLPFAIMSA